MPNISSSDMRHALERSGLPMLKSAADAPAVKTAQDLELVKAPYKLKARELTRALRDAVSAEIDAIKQYESIVDSTDNKDVARVLQAIADEEKVHVGEINALLIRLLPDEAGHMQKGMSEVEGMLGGETKEDVNG